jgi:hypothetical protein
VKTLESKETKAQRNETVTHNSVFAAHRLQCRMTIRKIDIRHFVYPAAMSPRGCDSLTTGGSELADSSAGFFTLWMPRWNSDFRCGYD